MCSWNVLTSLLLSNDTMRIGGQSPLLLFSSNIVALFTFSYNVNEYIGLPSFNIRSFLVAILNTDSIADSSNSSFVSPFDAAFVPLLYH